MNKAEIKAAIREIGLALNAVNGTVATDLPTAEPGDTSWRVDHSLELAMLDAIEMAIFNSDICPVCGGRNTCP
jgi:hypothetical protein